MLKPKFEQPEYIDNFLPAEEFLELKSIFLNLNGKTLPYYPQKSVTYKEEAETLSNFHGSWMATHPVFDDFMIRSDVYPFLGDIFIAKFCKMDIIKSIIRIKANFYPWTASIIEHSMHFDYKYFTKAAIFSLNTCDGYTKFSDGTKVDSVENRIVFFDSSKEHCSTTTTNYYGRFNINFNFL